MGGGGWAGRAPSTLVPMSIARTKYVVGYIAQQLAQSASLIFFCFNKFIWINMDRRPFFFLNDFRPQCIVVKCTPAIFFCYRQFQKKRR